MEHTDIHLEPGINRLPQVYNPTVWVAARDPAVSVRVSIAPEIETSPSGARSPVAATVALPMAWEDALRLALTILSFAQSARVPLPEGVVVPDRDWEWLTSNRPPRKPGGWQANGPA